MNIHLEQTLHGYDMGHGLLATSVPSLEREDVSLMATLSDWTGYRGTTDEEDNYLTVYPLPSGKFMAFAKTWYAKEMERPGCVWTHTLLIPVACLRGNFDLRKLLSLFVRPEKNKYAFYNKPLELDFESVSNYDDEPIFGKIDKIAFLFLFSVLINGLKGACFGIDRCQYELQLLLLSLLQYLPLNMLLNASVSSGSETVRKINNNRFSIQFIMGFNAETLQEGSWRNSLVPENFTIGQRYLYDVACMKNDKTSYLIHLFNNDIGDSEVKLEAVVNLLKALDEAVAVDKKTPSYNEILTYVFGVFPKTGEGKLVKANFLGKKITDFFCSDSECLHCVALRKVEEEDWKYVHLEQRLPHLTDSELQSLAYSLVAHEPLTETPKKALLYIFEHMGATDINSLVEYKWESLKDLILGNDSYIKNEFWLLLEKEHFNDFFASLPNEYAEKIRHWENLLSCVLKNETTITDFWAKKIIDHVSSAVIKIFDYAEQNPNCLVDKDLLGNCLLSVHDCLDWMNQQTDGINNTFLLVALTSHLDPFSREVRDYPSPFWVGLLNSSCKNSSYLSFVFALAFQQVGQNCLLLLKKSFDDIYMLQSKSHFPAKDWRRIALSVDEIRWVKDWDKCKQLCLSVIKFLHQLGYNRDIVKEISNNHSVKERLMKYWKKMYK